MSEHKNEGSIANRINPEGRLAPNEHATPDFETAVSPEHGHDGDIEAGETSVGDGRRRFEEIKAACRYCGRFLEPDHSL